MTMLTMNAPSHHAGFKRDYPWDGMRPTEYSSQPRSEPERIALPSIRQAFPELRLRVQQDDLASSPSTTSPPAGYLGVMAQEYVHSPNQNKRRRLSIEDDQEAERYHRISRQYATPSVTSHQPSPSLPPMSATDSWGGSSRASPNMQHGCISTARSPLTMEVKEHMEPRPTLPSLPMLTFEREHPRPRGSSGDDYGIRSAYGAGPASALDHPSLAYRTAPLPYYGHPSRMQSLSVGSLGHFEHSGLSANQHLHGFMRMGELSAISMSGDTKQRKRRGNLPKETTDKLRGWFMAHLSHPYPTEDEKQDLMRQTGLQMNQISNWFINARRRQLPAIINNAQAENDATSGRGEGKVIPSTERGEYDDIKRGSALSDGEGSVYDDDMAMTKLRRPAHLSRGSI